MSRELASEECNTAAKRRVAQRTYDRRTAEVISDIATKENNRPARMLQMISIQLRWENTANDVLMSAHLLRASKTGKDFENYRLPKPNPGSGAAYLTHEQHMEMLRVKLEESAKKKKAAEQKRAEIAKGKEEKAANKKNREQKRKAKQNLKDTAAPADTSIDCHGIFAALLFIEIC